MPAIALHMYVDVMSAPPRACNECGFACWVYVPLMDLHVGCSNESFIEKVLGRFRSHLFPGQKDWVVASCEV